MILTCLCITTCEYRVDPVSYNMRRSKFHRGDLTLPWPLCKSSLERENNALFQDKQTLQLKHDHLKIAIQLFSCIQELIVHQIKCHDSKCLCKIFWIAAEVQSDWIYLILIKQQRKSPFSFLSLSHPQGKSSKKIRRAS